MRHPVVLFDLDGTLIDSEALVRRSYIAAANDFSIVFTEAHFHGLVGLHRAANDIQMRAYFGDDFPLADFYTRVATHIGDAAAPLKTGAAALLDRLDQLGLPFALATSSGPDWVSRHFRAHFLTERFRVVVTRDDVVNRKPHPEPYLKAAAGLGFAPADILALEDSPTGFESAHASGMMTVLVPDLLQPSEDMKSRAVHIAQSLLDVADLLEQ